MSIPANAKLQVHPDGRIFYRGADLTGVPVTPDEALAHISGQRQRFAIGDVEYDRVLTAVRTAKQQSGEPLSTEDAPQAPRPAPTTGDDQLGRDVPMYAARNIISELGHRRAALATAHRQLIESVGPILGDHGTDAVEAANHDAPATRPARATAAPAATRTAVDESDPFASPPNAATSLNAKREVLHVIDVPVDCTIDKLKDQKAATKWLSGMASKITHAQRNPAMRPVLAAALVGPNGVGRKLAAMIYARMLFDAKIATAPRVNVIDLRRVIESGADLHAVVRHCKQGVILMENAEILDRDVHHGELNLIEALAACVGEPVLVMSGAKSLRGTLDADYRTRDTLRTQIPFTGLTADTLMAMFVKMAADKYKLLVGGDEVDAILEESCGRMSTRLYPDGKVPETPHSDEVERTLTGADVAPATFYEADGSLPALERLKRERSSQKNFIAWAESYAKRVVENQRKLTAGVAVEEDNNNILLLGEKGTGKTTAVEFINDLLYEIGERNGKLTYITSSELIGSTEAETKELVLDFLKRAKFGVGAIDEMHTLAKTEMGRYAISVLVPHLLNESGTTTVIGLGYPEEMKDVLDPDIDQGTDRRFPLVNRITLDVPELPDLRAMLVSRIKNRGYNATDEVIDAAMRIVDVLKTRAGFGNGGAIRDLVAEAITRLANRVRTPDTMNDLIASDFGDQPDTIDNVVRRLESFVGFGHLQAALSKIGATVDDQRIKKKPVREGYKPFARIIGDSGTGRKTFANELTHIYKAFSLVGSDEPFVTDVTTLKGDVVGAAITLTNKELRRVASAGGHLVLHNLKGLVDNKDQYTTDVISTLKSGLREHGKNIAVSLVGTDKEIADFLKLDQTGVLASLFNRRFETHVMDADAAGKVLAKKIEAFDLQLHDEAKAQLIEVMQHLIEQPNWNNGLDLETLAQAVRDEHLSVRRQPEYAEWDRSAVSSEALINAVDYVIAGKGGLAWEARAPKLAAHLPAAKPAPAKTAAPSKRKRDSA